MVRPFYLTVALCACTAPEPVDPTGDTADASTLLHEFDGVAPNGTWVRAAPQRTAFPFVVAPDSLSMVRDSGANQHLLREGVTFEPGRPWELCADVVIGSGRADLNSFAVLFRVSTDATAPLSAHAVNVSLNRGVGKAGGVAKSMGFVDGAFRSFGEASFETGRPGEPLSVRLRVNRTPSGETIAGFATFDVTGPDGPVVSVAEDWSAHPHDPPDQPLQFGFNGHGADWTLRNLTLRWLD